MSENRDRAVYNFAIDGDVKAVLEFMRESVPANKIVAVAERLPDMARLLWHDVEQEPCRPISLEADTSSKLGSVNPSLLDASELLPAPKCVGGDSVVVADVK